MQRPDDAGDKEALADVQMMPVALTLSLSRHESLDLGNPTLM